MPCETKRGREGGRGKWGEGRGEREEGGSERRKEEEERNITRCWMSYELKIKCENWLTRSTPTRSFF